MRASGTTDKQAAALTGDIGRLSEVVCWTRMQAEAGQDLSAIVLRKELERGAGDGTFCWGIGNAPPRCIAEYVQSSGDIDVVFSIMKSLPKKADVSPSGIVVWRSYFDAAGKERMLPPNVLVTSSVKSSGRAHYALMCKAETKLSLSDLGSFDPSAYRNVSEAARPVGASQVTALVRKVEKEQASSGYRINLLARLAHSYWVKLGNPRELSSRSRLELFGALADLSQFSPSDWLKLVLKLRAEGGRKTKRREEQLALFAA